jgi:hypothetical protein
LRFVTVPRRQRERASRVIAVASLSPTRCGTTATSGAAVVVVVVVVVAAGPKLALTAAFAASETTQVLAVAAALHAPLQPAKDEPPLGVAVSVTDVPISQSAEQIVPHAIPSGVLETVPDPAPASVTESVAVLRGVGGGGGGGGGGCAIWIDRESLPPAPTFGET